MEELYQNEIAEIKNSFLEIFPNGFIDIESKDTLAGYRMEIKLGLIGNISDQTNMNVRNDPMYHFLVAKSKNADRVEIETILGGLKCLPDKGTFEIMKTLKTHKRTRTTTMYMHVMSFKNWFTRLAEVVKQNQNNLYKRNVKPQYFEIND